MICLSILWVLVLTAHSTRAAATSKTVTHEDIKDAMLNMVHLFRDHAEKLERHELRERQLGEILKRALSGLDKRERAQDMKLEHMTTALNSLIGVVGKLESILVAQTDTAKSAYTVDYPLQSLATQVKTLIQPEGEQTRLEDLETRLTSKIDYLSVLVEKLQSDVAASGNHIAALSVSHRQNSQDHVNKKVLDALQAQAEILNGIQSMPGLRNATSDDTLRYIQREISGQVTAGNERIESKIGEVAFLVQGSAQEFGTAIKDARDTVEGFLQNLEMKMLNVAKESDTIEEISKTVLKTSDNVVDTRRRVELGLHQVLSTVSDFVESQNNDVKDTVTAQFSGIAETILDGQTGAVSNLSAKVESEISQVWRQIGIMHTQITASAGVLDKVQNQTESLVKDSANKMDAMDSKLDEIESELMLIQDNHNFLLGRLTLFTHEFNETRSALADAAQNIKDAYSVDKTDGPGPIPIEQSKYDNDNTL